MSEEYGHISDAFDMLPEEELLKDLIKDVELDYDEEDLKQDMKTLEELMNED